MNMVRKATADENLRELATKVRRSGDQYVIEDGGEEIAAVVPISYVREREKEREEARERFFASVDRIRERNEGVDPEQVERDVAEAMRARRKKSGS